MACGLKRAGTCWASRLTLSLRVGSSRHQRRPAIVSVVDGCQFGWKTTLLECMAYACILGHMGLPVPAKAARIGKVEALHILAKAGGTQSAGALEQTLVELATVVSDPTRS